MPQAYFGRWLYFKILTLVFAYGMSPLLPQPFFDRKYEVRHFTPIFIMISPLNTSKYTAVCGHFPVSTVNYPLSEQLSKAMKKNSDYSLQSKGKHLHVLQVKRQMFLCAKAFVALLWCW